MKDDPEIPSVVWAIVIVVLLIAIIWRYHVDYNECMSTKNDEIVCKIYARGAG